MKTQTKRENNATDNASLKVTLNQTQTKIGNQRSWYNAVRMEHSIQTQRVLKMKVKMPNAHQTDTQPEHQIN